MRIQATGLFLVFFSTLIGGCATTQAARAPSSSTSAKFVAGNQYSTAVSQALASAKSSIDVVQFNFGESTGLAEKLVQIKSLHENDRNFRIRVVVEGSGFGADRANQQALATLQSGGFVESPANVAPYAFYRVTGKTDAKGNTGITHTKLLLVDGHLILAGSTNWTTTSITKNNETDLLIESPPLGQVLLDYINKVQVNSTELDSGTASDGNLTLYTDQAFGVAIQQFLASTQPGDQLDCSMYFFNVGDTTPPAGWAPADTLEKELAVAAKKASRFQLMLESSNLAFSAAIVAGNKNAVAALEADGVGSIFWDDPSIISHMKFCVLTRASGGYSILMGSTNWNYLDMDLNHQLNWLVEDSSGGIAKPLLNYFSAALHQPGVAPASAR